MTYHHYSVIITLVILLGVVAGCASPAPTATPSPTPTPTPAPVNLRIAYTSDAVGNIDPVSAVGCG